MGEEKKPSSLRTRIDRARSTYDRKTNPAPIIVGVSFVLVVGIVLYFMLFSTPPIPARRPNKAPKKELVQPANPNWGPASGRSQMPKSDEESANAFCEKAKRDARDSAGNIDKSVEMLRGSLGKWPKYDAELYFAMGICISNREGKLQGAARTQHYQDKLDYYRKALDLVEQQNGKFTYGTRSVRINNLKKAIAECESKVGSQ